jgi:ribokinase
MIVTFGSINLDLFFHLPELPRPGQTLLAQSAQVEAGGKGANQAFAAACDGARVVMAGAVGQDALAESALAGLRAAGVDLSRVAQLAGQQTGCASIGVDAQGRNAIVVAPGANRLARAAQVEDALLGPGTTLLLQMENDPQEIAAMILRARRQGARIVLNLAPALELAPEILRSVDLLVLNESEAEWLSDRLGIGASAEALHQALEVDVVRTLGGKGVELATADGVQRLAAWPVEVVDSTGAGDCFTGVLASALDRGTHLGQALLRANAAAALACTRAGSQRSAPQAGETDHFLAMHR